jgi:GNAT superfamily N-acetyltransferase
VTAPAPRTVHVTRTYLELLSDSQLRPATVDDPTVRVEQAIECPPSYYRYLYREVGHRYAWRDRQGWTEDQIRAHVARAEISVWVMYRAGSPVGWFELLAHDDGSVELAYFGLLPHAIGRGLGKHLLSVAARTAWSAGARRVWLHTCTLDNPAALPNYQARGFTVFKQEQYTVEL